MAEVVDAFECSSSAQLGFDVRYDERIGAHGVVGVLVKDFDPDCADRVLVVIARGPAGEPLATSRVRLAVGGSGSFADAGPVDARDVMGLDVLLG